MNTYILEMPVLTIAQSQKKHPIFDKDKNTVGFVNRYYKNPIEKILSYLGLNEVITNVKVEDENGKTKALLQMTSSLVALNSTWAVTIYNHTGEENLDLNLVPKIGFSKNFELVKKSKTYIICDKTIGTEPHFYDEQGNLIAKCFDSLGKEKEIYHYTGELDPYFVWGMCYLVSLL